MMNYRFVNGILLIHPHPTSKTIDDITNLINKLKPTNHVIIWQPWEETDNRLTEYLEHDYNENDNHHPNIVEFENVLLKNKINCYLLVGSDRNDAYLNLEKRPLKNFEVLFWPTALLHLTYYSLISFYGKTPIELFNPNLVVDKLYLNLNNKDRQHRCMLMDYLCKYDLFEIGINTWRYENSTYQFKYFIPQKIKIDEYSDRNFVHEVWTENLQKTTNLIDIIGETAPNIGKKEFIFHTEKTFRSILLGKPFLVMGNRNQNKNLEKYGFKLFENIFDYDFDNFDSMKSRCMGIIDNLYSIKNLDYNEIKNNLFPKINSNIQTATNIVNYDRYIPEILKFLIKNNIKEYEILLKDFNQNFINGYLNRYQPYEKWSIIDVVLKLKKII